MSDKTEQTVNQIADGVVTATDVVAPALGAAGGIVAGIVHAIRALISIAEQLGHGDAVREALDAELASGRQATDAALAAKHGRAITLNGAAATVHETHLSYEQIVALAGMTGHPSVVARYDTPSGKQSASMAMGDTVPTLGLVASVVHTSGA